MSILERFFVFFGGFWEAFWLHVGLILAQPGITQEPKTMSGAAVVYGTFYDPLSAPILDNLGPHFGSIWGPFWSKKRSKIDVVFRSRF